MTTAALNGSWKPISEHNQIPVCIARPLAASEQIGKGQFVTVSRTTGYAYLADGTETNRICVGLGDYSELSDTSATAGLAYARISNRWCSGIVQSTTTNDYFSDADFCSVFWVKDGNTAGKLSHTGADATLVNRSIGGLYYGLDPISNTPILWSSPIAWDIARAHHIADNIVVAADSFTLTANTTRAEASMTRRAKVHGTLSAVKIMADAGFTAHDTNYWTITVAKRTSTTPGTAVTIATATLQTTSGGGLGNLTAWLPVTLTPSSTATALDILEDDVLTVTCTAQTTAAGIARFNVEVVVKVG